MKLIWKAIVGYEGLYEVSNYGEVRSIERKVKHKHSGEITIKGRLVGANDNHYRSVQLSTHGKRKKFRIRKLVMDAFGPACPGEYGVGKGMYQIDHIDDNKLNNRIDNLQWLIHEDNCFWKHEATHPFRTQTPHRGEKHGMAKLTEAQVKVIRNDNRSQRVIGKEYGVDASLIGLIKRRKCWTHIK